MNTEVDSNKQLLLKVFLFFILVVGFLGGGGFVWVFSGGGEGASCLFVVFVWVFLKFFLHSTF